MVESVKVKKASKNKSKNELNEKANNETPEDDAMMTREVLVSFKTTMPEKYQVPDSEITLSTASTSKELTQVVKQLMMEENEGDDDFQKEIKSKKMNFMVNDTFMNLSLQDLLE